MEKHGVNHKLNESLVDLTNRITGYDKDVILEYVKINDNKYSILANLSLQSIYTNSKENQKLMNDLYYLNRKMKIDKLLSKNE